MRGLQPSVRLGLSWDVLGVLSVPEGGVSRRCPAGGLPAAGSPRGPKAAGEAPTAGGPGHSGQGPATSCRYLLNRWKQREMLQVWNFEILFFKPCSKGPGDKGFP